MLRSPRALLAATLALALGVLAALPAGADQVDEQRLRTYRALVASQTRPVPPARLPSSGLTTVAATGGTAAVAPAPSAAEEAGPPPTDGMMAPPLRQGFTAPIGTTPSDQRPIPFGSNLFTGSFAPIAGAQSGDYVIGIGDRITVRLFGGVTVDGVQTVDPAGNIFVPTVGPINVVGLTAGALQSRVETSVRALYTDAVEVYATVEEPGSVGVFVAGSVRRPGRYAGTQNDSLFYFLDRAGGIDLRRGSFRAIRVLRGQEVLGVVDIYDFMTTGQVPYFEFREGDSIFVEPVGTTVAAIGAVQAAYQFEFRQQRVTGADLMALARPDPFATHAVVRGVRNGVPYSDYQDIAKFRTAALRSSDIVEFRSDRQTDMIAVTLDAHVNARKTYILPRDATIRELLAAIPIDNSLLDLDAVHLKRIGVAARQKDALDESLARLERTALTTPSQTAEEATLRVQEAQLITSFVERARKVVPDGRVVVVNEGRLTDMRLEDGDIVVIPDKTDVIIVGGEVIAPGAFGFTPGLRLRDYLERAGGAFETADTSDFIIRSRDGSSRIVGGSETIRAGDEILVLPTVETKYLQFAKDITSILFQAALTAAGVITID